MVLSTLRDPLTRRALQLLSPIFGIVISCAIVQGSLWDNLGCWIGIWTFNTDKITSLGKGQIPIEEYTWITLHCFNAIFFAFQLYILLLLLRRRKNKSLGALAITKQSSPVLYMGIKVLVIAAYAIVFVIGGYGVYWYRQQQRRDLMTWSVLGCFFAPFLLCVSVSCLLCTCTSRCV